MSNATQNALGTMAFLALCNTTAADGPQEGRWRELPEEPARLAGPTP